MCIDVCEDAQIFSSANFSRMESPSVELHFLREPSLTAAVVVAANLDKMQEQRVRIVEREEGEERGIKGSKPPVSF